MHFRDGMLARFITLKVIILLIIVALPLLLSYITVSKSVDSNVAFCQDISISSSKNAIIPGNYQFLDINLNYNVERICVIAYYGDSIPLVKERSISNYYKWEFDKGKWKDASNHDLEYIKPNICKKENDSYSFYLKIDKKALPGKWTIKILVDGIEVNTPNTSFIVGSSFQFFISTLISFYEPNCKYKKNQFISEFISTDQEEISLESKKDIDDIIDRVLSNRFAINKDRTEEKYHESDQLKVSFLKKQESIKVISSIYSRSKYKVSQKNSINNIFFYEKWGGKKGFEPIRSNSYWRFMAILITVILLSVLFFPIITPQNTSLQSPPNITFLSVHPSRVKFNDSIMLNVSVSDSSGVALVYANIYGMEDINLTYIQGNIENDTIVSGLWQTRWIVQFEKPGDYNVTIIALNNNNCSCSQECIFNVFNTNFENNSFFNDTANNQKNISINISKNLNITEEINNSKQPENFTIKPSSNISNYTLNSTKILENNIPSNYINLTNQIGENITNNDTILIVDKKHEKLSVIPGTKFFVERTVNGPHGNNVVFVPMYSDSLILESMEIIEKNYCNYEFPKITNSNRLANIFNKGNGKLEREKRIEKLKDNLPEEIKSLNKIAYSNDFELQSPITIRLWFRAPTWEEIQYKSKLSSGEISYLVFSNDTNSFDFEGSTWWESTWGSRKLITINSSFVESDLVNFPVYFYESSDSELASHAQDDGDDIAFVLWDDNTTKLNHEIEFFNGLTGEIVAWINVTELSSSSDTKIWMYYNNNDSSCQQNPSDVWDDNFVLVQHLNETSKTTGSYNDHLDSTHNNNNGETFNGVNMNIAGRLDGGDEFGGDNSNDYIAINDDSTLDITDEISISIWLYLYDYSNTPDLVTKGPYDQSYGTWVRASGTVRFAVNGNSITSASSLNTGTWYYLTFTRDSSTNGRKIFINGLENASDTLTTAFNTNNDPLYISTDSYEIGGIIDEVRISNIARTSGWIRTCYNNMNVPDVFFITGNENNITDTIVDNICPFNVTYSPYIISATADNSLNNVTLFYRYSVDNNSYDSWTKDNTDSLSPWQWNFNFPNGTGYYEFYSIGKKFGFYDENPPFVADTICYYNSSINTAAFIYGENPANGSINIQRIPKLNVTVNDADNDLLDIIWWSNSSGSWLQFAYNNSINTSYGAVNIIQTNSNFSDFLTTYWWSINTTDGVEWTNKTYSFITKSISTSVDTIMPYGITSPKKTITATGDLDIGNVKLYYRWSSDNISWGKKSVSIFDGFETGSINASLWATYQSGGDARIQFDYSGTTRSGSYSCAMDDFDTQTTDSSLNELYSVYDFTGASNIILDFWQYDADDEESNAPSSWVNHGNYDAVSFTNDGNTWYEIIDATTLDQDDLWTHYTYNISNHPNFNPVVTSNFAIKFQQYDNYQINLGADWDGRMWDDIFINFSSTNNNGTDWIEWYNSSNPDYVYPWNWSFDFPNSTGYYEFYSIGSKLGEINETSPDSADTRCYYNSIGSPPTIELITPSPNGTTNVAIPTICRIRANDINNDELTVYWYENTTGEWVLRNTNNNVNASSIVSYTFSEFSNYSATYWWKVIVNDSRWNTSSVYFFTTGSIITSIGTIIPYIVTSYLKDLHASGSSDLDNVKLYYRWSSDNISWGKKSVSIFDGFETGSINASLWATYQSGGDARIQFDYSGTTRSGSYSCAMDDFDTQTTDSSLNELYSVYDFTGASNIILDFWQYDADDEESNAPSSWVNHGNYDAVSFTNDGNTWYEIIDATTLDQDDLWTHYTYNISNHPNFNPVVTSNFAIKFQQYDNYQINLGADWDGRMWDDIFINFSSTNNNGTDWIEWYNSSNPDYVYPWNWSFDFPNSTGYYEFYSLGNKTGSPNETSPVSADAKCYFGYIPPTTPVINSYDLVNITGSKLNNASGLIDVNNEYCFFINITDENGWEDIDYINITSWFDWGSDSSFYNQTLGGNLNMFLQYENTSGTSNYKKLWPNREAQVIISNCSETIISGNTRLINITFKPLSQVRWACSNNTWNFTEGVYNDPYSWNFNITVEDSTNRKSWKINEYGIYKFTSISPGQDWVDVYALPGFNDSSNIVNIIYSSNHEFNMTVFFEENLTNFTRGDFISIANNVDILADADFTDDIISDITFLGVGETNKIDIFNESGIFHYNNVNQVVYVQFDVYIPFGTQAGKYTARVTTKIFQK